MPRLTIDNRLIEVPHGWTILQAAQQLGITIPTLCYLEGYAPATSCLVCLVKDRRTGRLLPACATHAVEGMEIESETESVHEVRRTALELLFSEHAGDCRAPCFFACPAHMDIPLMLREISDHALNDAIATIKRDIALPAVLGRVCPKPCEKGCRRAAADGAVAVCELKRFVADQDLASPQPYQPACRPATGKRVAVVGAGPTGLAAVYYLRQLGHDCLLIDAKAHPGGRVRTEAADEQLPRQVLDREIEQILALGVELRMNCRIETREQLDELCAISDAVLLACGAVPAEQVQRWGLPVTRRGIAAAHDTYQTSRPGIFAAGTVLRGSGLVVRSCADGKEAAQSIDRYLSGAHEPWFAKPFSSRLGKVADDELPVFLAEASTSERWEPQRAEGGDFSLPQATDQSQRCLGCDCAAHGQCRLEYYGALYHADPRRFDGQRPAYRVSGRAGSVRFEPGKCIKCELCIKITERAGERLGLTFVGRGFDVQLAVPFDHSWDDGLGQVAAQCVAACPTGALSFGRHGRTGFKPVVP